MKSIHVHSDLPELSHFNTSKAREADQALKLRSKTMYLSLLDAAPNQQIHQK